MGKGLSVPMNHFLLSILTDAINDVIDPFLRWSQIRLDLEVQTENRQRMCHIEPPFGRLQFLIVLGVVCEPVSDNLAIPL